MGKVRLDNTETGRGGEPRSKSRKPVRRMRKTASLKMSLKNASELGSNGATTLSAEGNVDNYVCGAGRIYNIFVVSR